MSSSYALLQDILLRFLSAGMHGENVAVVVALDDESLQSNTQDSALEDFSKASRSRVVVKVRSPAIAPLLVASNSNNSLVLDDEFELPIIGSLLSTPPAVASRSAVVLRDQTALLVYSNHVEDVVQYVVDIDRRLHHSSHFYSRRAPMPLPGDAISCQPPDIQEGFIFAPQDYLTEDAWLDDPVLGLPEIDVPLNAVPPFESEGRSEYKDSAFPLPQIRLDDSASLGASLTGVYESLLSGIAPPSLNPFWVNNASTDTEYTTTYSDTTISPSLLYLPVYTPDYATLSPSSTLNATSPTMLSDARTPSPFDVYTPSTSTLEDLSVSPEVKLDTEQSPIDQWHLSSSSLSLPEPPSWSPSSASSTALPRTIPQETPAVTLSDSKHNATSVALGKRKRGSSHIPMFAAGVSDTTTSRLRNHCPSGAPSARSHKHQGQWAYILSQDARSIHRNVARLFSHSDARQIMAMGIPVAKKALIIMTRMLTARTIQTRITKVSKMMTGTAWKSMGVVATTNTSMTMTQPKATKAASTPRRMRNTLRTPEAHPTQPRSVARAATRRAIRANIISARSAAGHSSAVRTGDATKTFQHARMASASCGLVPTMAATQSCLARTLCSGICGLCTMPRNRKARDRRLGDRRAALRANGDGLLHESVSLATTYSVLHLFSCIWTSSSLCSVSSCYHRIWYRIQRLRVSSGLTLTSGPVALSTTNIPIDTLWNRYPVASACQRSRRLVAVGGLGRL
ncbi:uncharacterized protein C8Q71DRAFT_278779 [Rhodofomes roseus]|uniref:DUF7928 domain-containing protein n=1 Tax=Rhodofomes roseus TaxID=34475 RepID=A0ABQ8K4Z7_9APHY|nr:uncharacterized protein C8Q71DRAFT_278779 [Rhodofomes roseus]KAH9832037.1 hypothetical protein C8Q71DRAFT_278779 [Rhodofomes roseus]